MDKSARRYQRLAHDLGVEDTDLSANLEKLYSELWAPIEGSLPSEVGRVIISPDGQLNFVSFATLLDSKNRFLSEKYDVQYVGSGRDLLREIAAPSSIAAVVFANPDFNLGSNSTTHKPDSESSNTAGEARPGGGQIGFFEDLFLNPLPGTQQECDRLTKDFESWGWHGVSFTGKEATKEALLQIHSPYILHIATAGFFAPEEQSGTNSVESQPLILESRPTQLEFLNNPMHRSGFVLAGANTTLERWKRGEVPPPENDGIVTAEDVATLDLKGTWLVTLSANDTGSGEARAGEGVIGLRRGFIQAGAQNLLLAFGEVIDDQFTAQFMSDFYEEAHKSGNASRALAKVQGDWLSELRKRRGLTMAVHLAGPFFLISQGKR